jgi:hypothetical protein
LKTFDPTLREYVIRAISDDYESLELILESVIGWAVERAGVADKEGTLKALVGLIEDGYAQAYVLGRDARPVDYSESSLDDLWFYVTPNGMKFLKQFQEDWQ